MCAGITAAFSSWWCNDHNNAVCGRHLCKLFTINLRAVVDVFVKKGKNFWGLFFPLDFCNSFGGGEGVEDVRHDVLCLNVFECLLYSEMSVCRYKKEKPYTNDLCILSSLMKFITKQINAVLHITE